MKDEIFKYKNYLLLLSALLVANFLLTPLSVLLEEQIQKVYLLEKQQVKTSNLINNTDEFNQKGEQVDQYLKNATNFLYTQKSESDFKLIAQTQIEKLLQESACTIERIGFKGKQQILPQIQKWHMEIRYSGDASCLLKATRGLETAKPYINIEEYKYNADNVLDKTAEGRFNAILSVSVWFDNQNSAKEGE